MKGLLERCTCSKRYIMKDMRKMILEVVKNQPDITSLAIAQALPDAKPIRIQEAVSRLFAKNKLQRRRKDCHFLYRVKESLQPNPPVVSTQEVSLNTALSLKTETPSPAKEDNTDFSEYLVLVRRNNHEFRKSADNNIDLNNYLLTLESADDVAVYRRIECQKKIIYQLS